MGPDPAGRRALGPASRCADVQLSFLLVSSHGSLPPGHLQGSVGLAAPGSLSLAYKSVLCTECTKAGLQLFILKMRTN